MNPFSKLTILILFSFFISCAKNEDNPVTPSPNITFSNSPIDLQGINAKFAKDIAYDSKTKLNLIFGCQIPALRQV
jgi:hypothetical protein